MRIVRLADYLEYKYNLKSEAASLQDVMKSVKFEILTIYKNYISVKTSVKSYNAIPFFAQQGEVHCSEIVEDMEKIVKDIDKLATNPDKLFKMVNDVLGTIKELDFVIKEGMESPERLDRQSQLNQYRHEIKKLEESIKRVSSMLFKQARILQKFVPGQELAGEPTIPRRKPLSKDKLRMFMFTPFAKSYGLDNMDLMTEILEDEPLKQKLTTIINAIDRGHSPVDAPDLVREVSILVDLAKQKLTNQPYFEAGEDVAKEMARPKFISPEEIKYRKELEKDKQQRAEEDRKRLEPLIQKRDEEHRQRTIEEDRDRHIRSESVSSLLNKLLLKGIYENR